MKKIETGLQQGFQLTDESAKLQTRLQADIARHNSAVDQLAAQIAAIRDVKPTEFTAKHDAEAAKLSSRRREVLQQELELRAQIANFLDRVRDIDYPSACDATFRAHEAATAEVREAVIKLGFQDDEHGQVLPFIVERHPKVKSLRIESDNLPHCDTWLPAMRANQLEIERGQKRLATIQQESVAVLS